MQHLVLCIKNFVLRTVRHKVITARSYPEMRHCETAQLTFLTIALEISRIVSAKQV